MLVVVSDDGDDLREQFDVLPLLAAEDLDCASCRLDFSSVTVEQVLEAISLLLSTIRETVAAAPENSLRLRLLYATVVGHRVRAHAGADIKRPACTAVSAQSA